MNPLPTHPRSRRLPALLAVCTMVLAACGSTVRVVGPDLTIEEAVALGASPPPSAGESEPTGSTGASPQVTTSGGGSTTGGSTAGTTTGGGSTGGTSTTGTTGGGGGTATTGDTTGTTGTTGTATTGSGTTDGGVTDTTPIKVGAIILKNGEYVMSGMGTEVSFGDGRKEVTAVVNEVNRTGGIGGRPIDLYIAEVDVAAADPNTEYNNACLKLTEDNDVFVVVTVINPPETFISCVGNHKKLLLNASFSPGDEQLYAEYRDWFFSPTLLSLDRGVALELNVAREQGMLGDEVKVGVLYYDGDPQPVRVVDGTVKPMLDAWGIEYVTAGINDPSQVGPAQVQFAGAGVNTVVFVTPNGIAQLLFMNAAENQMYRPKYITTDTDSTRFVSQNAPRGQARNIWGVGTLPISNVPVRSYPTTPIEETCLDIIRKGGENNSDRLSNVTATLYCELIWEFEFVGEQVQGPMTYDKWRAAYRASGTSYQAVSTFGVDFSSGHNAGATFYRTYAWSDDCNCLQYTSPTIPVPAS